MYYIIALGKIKGCWFIELLIILKVHDMVHGDTFCMYIYIYDRICIYVDEEINVAVKSAQTVLRGEASAVKMHYYIHVKKICSLVYFGLFLLLCTLFYVLFYETRLLASGIYTHLLFSWKTIWKWITRKHIWKWIMIFKIIDLSHLG